MQVQLSSNGYDILASGEAFLFQNPGDLAIQVRDGDILYTHVVLKFPDVPNGPRRVDVSTENNCLILSCYGFSARQGEGVNHPVHIATVNNKAIYLTFWTKLDGGKPPYTRSVRFTLFCEREHRGESTCQPVST